ncbi:MAG: hypothetical protein QXX87_00980 [Candidatus Jordarchaeales archaeon]
MVFVDDTRKHKHYVPGIIQCDATVPRRRLHPPRRHHKVLVERQEE